MTNKRKDFTPNLQKKHKSERTLSFTIAIVTILVETGPILMVRWHTMLMCVPASSWRTRSFWRKGKCWWAQHLRWRWKSWCRWKSWIRWRSRLKRSNWLARRFSEQPMLIWDLPMPTSCINLDECVASFLADAECVWTCPSCGGTEATIRTAVQHFPRYAGMFIFFWFFRFRVLVVALLYMWFWVMGGPWYAVF